MIVLIFSFICSFLRNLNNVQDSNSQQMGRTPSPDNVYVNDKRHSTASG